MDTAHKGNDSKCKILSSEIYKTEQYDLNVIVHLSQQSHFLDDINLSQCFPTFFFFRRGTFNLLKPTGHVMHQQFNIQQLYVLPTLYLCVLHLSENKQRLVQLTA